MLWWWGTGERDIVTDCWRELGNTYQNFICFYILTHLCFVIITPIKTDPEDTAATVEVQTTENNLRYQQPGVYVLPCSCQERSKKTSVHWHRMLARSWFQVQK